MNEPPTTCPTCNGPVWPDEQPGCLYCPACEWPVWMALDVRWMATPPPNREEAEIQFRRGIVRIAKRTIVTEPEPVPA